MGIVPLPYFDSMMVKGLLEYTQNKMKFAIILVPQLRTVAICFLWLGFPFRLMRMTHDDSHFC